MALWEHRLGIANEVPLDKIVIRSLHLNKFVLRFETGTAMANDIGNDCQRTRITAKAWWSRKTLPPPRLVSDRLVSSYSRSIVFVAPALFGTGTSSRVESSSKDDCAPFAAQAARG